MKINIMHEYFSSLEKLVDMRGKLIILLIVLLPALCFAGESKVFTDSDLKTYGSDNSNGDSDYCDVISYDSHAQTFQKHPFIGTDGYIYNVGTFEGPTFLTVNIKNKSSQERIVYTPRDIKVHTIKGNIISPNNSETYYIKPGEIIAINGLNLGRVSKIVSVECSCW